MAQQHDGGKWTCGVSDMVSRPENIRGCIVYSFGSRNEDSFEQRILQQNPKCIGGIFVFDPTSPILPKYRFFPWGLAEKDGPLKIANKDYDGKRLETILDLLGHNEIDVLKFDIEGSEWGVLRTVNWSKLKIGQVLFEIHAEASGHRKSLGDVFDQASFLVELDRAGFRQSSLEPVCG